MALRIEEFFGYPLGDPAANLFIDGRRCPFVDDSCIKPDHGACTLSALRQSHPVICCPNRLYASNFQVVRDVCALAFGASRALIKPSDARLLIAQNALTGSEVVAFGRYFGQELPLPRAGSGAGSYYMDWVLTSLTPTGAVAEMTALEVQTIDTTGSYREQSAAAFDRTVFTDGGGRSPGYSNAGFNWENVSKRILPQVIYKGHALRREVKCTKGLFFACPTAVYDRIMDRLGGVNILHQYQMHPGAITFLAYDQGIARTLQGPASFTTTIDQVALAFTSPRNLPPPGCYEDAANRALQS